MTDEEHLFPSCVDIELTNRCNMSCKMCSRQLMTRPIGDMDFDTFKEIVHQIPTTTEIRFIRWGEPLLYRKLKEAVEYAKVRGFKITIVTNGLLVIPNINILLRVDAVRFSTQGTTKEEYEFLRTGSYDNLKYNVMKLMEARGSLKTPEISIGASFDSEDNNPEGFIKLWEGKVDKVYTWRTSYTRIANLHGFKKRKPKYVPCNEVLTRLSIDWDGDIVACCSDYNKELKLGNIKTMAIRDAWSSSKLKDLRRILTKEMGHEQFKLCKTCLVMT